MTTNAKMRKDSGMLPLWEPFSVFFCVVVYWGLLWHFRHAHTIHPFYFTYVHLYYHFVLFLEFPARFFFITFFTLIFWYFLSFFLFSFLSLLVWWLCFDIFLCWYMFKHVQTYTKARDFTRRMVFFFLMLNQSSGAVDVYGIMQSAIAVLSSHMLLFVALYIILFIHV